MAKVLGTPFEISLRLLQLLDLSQGKALTAGILSALDFITVYARDFDLAEENLHGDGSYRFGEFASRRGLARQALKSLVLDGLAGVQTAECGFVYSLTPIGREFCRSFACAYADDYRFSAQEVLAFFRGKTEHELTLVINGRALSSLQRS